MGQTTINGNDGTADVTIDSVSYQTVLQEFELEGDQQLIDSTTFNEEGEYKSEPGILIIHARLAGLLTKGADVSGPLIPPPLNVPCVFTYSTGCTITMNVNFSRGLARRTVNSNAIMTAEGESTGAVVKAWDTGA